MSFHIRLKEATWEQHKATEKLLFPDKNWTSLSLADYSQFLQIQYVFHQQAEQQVDTALSAKLKEKLNWPERRKLGWIESDLGEIGVDIPTGFTNDVAKLSEEEALGLLYVTEGSMLGGRMIEKVLQNNRQVAPHTSFHFLSGYGANTSTHWKSFLDTLENTTCVPETIITAARTGFDLFAKSVYLIKVN
ncbi:MAG: biliverdin-producing heme oxygenase [Bacteroidota bacterium]